MRKLQNWSGNLEMPFQLWWCPVCAPPSWHRSYRRRYVSQEVSVAGESSISHKNRKQLWRSLFWKMGLEKCAWDCSQSSISHKNRKKTVTFGAALDLCGRVHTAKCARDCSQSSISNKMLKNWGFQNSFGFVWSSSHGKRCTRDCSESSI